MYLFFDTETTGLPKNWKAPASDVNNWPRLVQIAWILCDATGNRLEAADFIIKPAGFTIPADSANIHGISNEKAQNEGTDLERVLKQFIELVNQADAIVAHNISFDEKIIGAELIRKKIPNSFNQKKKICTKESSTDFCQIPGKYGYKWPTLSELHQKLFGKDFEGAHNATADINATEKCFWDLKKRGVL